MHNVFILVATMMVTYAVGLSIMSMYNSKQHETVGKSTPTNYDPGWNFKGMWKGMVLTLLLPLIPAILAGMAVMILFKKYPEHF